MRRAESRSRVRHARGFTLIEVITALSVGGLAVMLATAMLATVSDHTGRVAEVAHAIDEHAGGELLLRRLVGQMTWSAVSEQPSRGTSHFLRFSTWCEVPAGWHERCVVDLRAGGVNGPARGIEARLSTGETLVLLSRTKVHGFLYLDSSERGGKWRDRWVDGMSLPPVIGVVTADDTLLVRTGERG